MATIQTNVIYDHIDQYTVSLRNKNINLAYQVNDMNFRLYCKKDIEKNENIIDILDINIIIQNLSNIIVNCNDKTVNVVTNTVSSYGVKFLYPSNVIFYNKKGKIIFNDIIKAIDTNTNISAIINQDECYTTYIKIKDGRFIITKNYTKDNLPDSMFIVDITNNEGQLIKMFNKIIELITSYNDTHDCELDLLCTSQIYESYFINNILTPTKSCFSIYLTRGGIYYHPIKKYMSYNRIITMIDRIQSYKGNVLTQSQYEYKEDVINSSKYSINKDLLLSHLLKFKEQIEPYLTIEPDSEDE